MLSQTSSKSDIAAWAQAEFGDAQLGNIQRTRRLVLMATRVAERPAGKISQVFTDDAELQGAYDWVENDKIAPEALAQSIFRATARRAQGHPLVFISTDGSSLSLTDNQEAHGTGRVGTPAKSSGHSTRGDQTHLALAIDPDGAPIGLCGYRSWVRTGPLNKQNHKRRKTEDKETQVWIDVREQSRQSFREHAPDVLLWFQHDRGADAWPVLVDALDQHPNEFTTIRTNANRCLVPSKDHPKDQTGPYLRDTLNQSPIFGQYTFDVSARPKRKARCATFQVRGCEVPLRLQDLRTDRRYDRRTFVVWVQEISEVPSNEDPIEWVLLTNYPVQSLEDARLVVFGYACRWRVEELHKAWKSGYTDVESTQLRTLERRQRWSLILASVSCRLLRLQYLARTQPDRAAHRELSTVELEILIDFHRPRRLGSVQTITMSQAVYWIAKLGGYTGKSSGGPPGLVTLGRGLKQIAIVQDFQKRRAPPQSPQNHSEEGPSESS